MAVLSISRHKHLHVFAHVYTHTLQQFYKLFFSSWGCLFLLFGLKYLHQSSFCFTNLTLGTPWWSFLELTSDHLQKELLVIIHLSRHFSHPPFFSLLKVTKIDSGQVYINSNSKRWFKSRKYIMLCYKILIKKKQWQFIHLPPCFTKNSQQDITFLHLIFKGPCNLGQLSLAPITPLRKDRAGITTCTLPEATPTRLEAEL